MNRKQNIKKLVREVLAEIESSKQAAAPQVQEEGAPAVEAAPIPLIEEEKGPVVFEAGAIKKRGRTVGARGKLYHHYTEGDVEAHYKELIDYLTTHDISHAVPVDKEVGRKLTSAGKIKAVINSLKPSAVEELLAAHQPEPTL